jgi:hypothetical protein
MCASSLTSEYRDEGLIIDLDKARDNRERIDRERKSSPVIARKWQWQSQLYLIGVPTTKKG